MACAMEPMPNVKTTTANSVRSLVLIAVLSSSGSGS
jgi:hypothetical protein